MNGSIAMMHDTVLTVEPPMGDVGIFVGCIEVHHPVYTYSFRLWFTEREQVEGLIRALEALLAGELSPITVGGGGEGG